MKKNIFEKKSEFKCDRTLKRIYYYKQNSQPIRIHFLSTNQIIPVIIIPLIMRYDFKL